MDVVIKIEKDTTDIQSACQGLIRRGLFFEMKEFIVTTADEVISTRHY